MILDIMYGAPHIGKQDERRSGGYVSYRWVRRRYADSVGTGTKLRVIVDHV